MESANNFVNNREGAVNKAHPPSYTQSYEQLIDRLSTDHSLLSFIWGWWKAGDRDREADEEHLIRVLNPRMPTPVCRLCKVAYEAGKAGLSFQAALQLARTVEDPAQPPSSAGTSSTGPEQQLQQQPRPRRVQSRD